MHRLDPRAKLIAMIGAVVLIVLTPPAAVISFACYAVILFSLLLVARVPLAFALMRLLTVLPCILLVAISIPFVKQGEVAGSFTRGAWHVSVTHEGIALFWSVLVKSALSLLCMVVLSATTRFDRMLRGLEMLHVPRLLIMILSFMYRYLFLISDDLMRMLRAKSARGPGGAPLLQMRTMAGMLGTLFVRAYERAERVYCAMCSRGFDGSMAAVAVPGVRAGDVIFLCMAAALFGAARLAGGIR